MLMQEDDGTFTVVGNKMSITGMADGTTQTKSFPLLRKLEAGTYRLTPASKPMTNEDWKPYYNMRDRYIEAVVDSTGRPTLRIVEPQYNISIDTIVFPGPRIVGQEQEIVVTFRNTADEYYQDVYLFASKTQSKVYTENLARVGIRKGETAQFSFYYTPEETDTYNLWFCSDKSGKNVIGTGTMEVITDAQAVKANLSISYAVVNGANNIAYGK